jgi:ATP-dependent RNA helicase SUPV3L1/SUV3
LVEVWRAGRSTHADNRRPRGRRRDAAKNTGRGATPPAPHGETIAPPAAAEASSAPPQDRAPAEGDASDKPGRYSGPRRPYRGGENRTDRPPRDRKHDRQGPRPARFDRREERREKAPDPNSPFAKLAALKAQLEADAKERR